MIASLYQRWSSGSAKLSPSHHSEEIVKIAFVADSPANPENMRGHGERVQFDIVAAPLPKVVRVIQQVVHVIRLLNIQLKKRHGQIHPSRLLMVGVQIHHD